MSYRQDEVQIRHLMPRGGVTNIVLHTDLEGYFPGVSYKIEFISRDTNKTSNSIPQLFRALQNDSGH